MLITRGPSESVNTSPRRTVALDLSTFTRLIRTFPRMTKTCASVRDFVMRANQSH
jgi:hypothetical protein